MKCWDIFSESCDSKAKHTKHVAHKMRQTEHLMIWFEKKMRLE